MKYTIPDCGKGLIKDLLPAELEPGFWSDAKNFRFRNGFAEKWEGAVSVVCTTTSGAGTAVQPLWFDVWNGQNISSAYIMYTNAAKVYANTVIGTPADVEITRHKDDIFISTITNVTTTATLTTTAAHGRTTGDSVTVHGAFPDAYNGTFVITVTGATTFTYTMLSDPGANASRVGAFYYATTQDFAGTAADRFTSGQLGRLSIINNPAHGLYYWDGDTSNRIKRVSAFGSKKAYAARVFKNFIVAMKITDGATIYGSRVQWSTSTEDGSLPTSFTSAADNDAGFQDLTETGGTLVDGLQLGEDFILYKSDCRYAMQYIGGNEVFRFTRLPGADGLVNRHCVVSTPVGHVFMTNEFDVKLHQGGEAKSIMDGRVRSIITSLTYEFYSRYFFMARNDEKKEVFIGLYSSDTATAGLVWNWESGAWGVLDYNGTEIVFGASALLPNVTGTTTEKQILLLSTTRVPTVSGSPSGAGDIGTGDYRYWTQIGATEGTLFRQTITGTLERIGMHIGSRDVLKHIQRSRWVIDGDAGETATIYHGSSMSADTAPTYSSGGTYTIGTTDYVSQRPSLGRYGAIKAITTSYPFRVRTIDLDIPTGGQR